MKEGIQKLIEDLPDPNAAERFLKQLEERFPTAAARLLKNDSLTSDVLTLAAFSPLLSTTLLQNPEYFWWLDRKRREAGVRSKDELLESLGQFSLTNSQLEPQILFARFRRRELLRIYLRDIRRLATVAEITEEISVLADSILEAALQIAKREMDNRFGQPLERDESGRAVPSRFCIIALGKLGSRELNYSSDIDLLFVYSADGDTSGSGSRGSVTNREYFVKLAEYLTKLVGHPTGEGAAYRVDLRLRPHGSLGPLARSLPDLVKYYETDARAWERQVMIRSRGCAGDTELYREFFLKVEHLIFSKDETPASALRNVRLSKERIDEQKADEKGIDIKLESGGIREIEFIAQALQLAYGGSDAWVRAPHTLISLGRLKDRGLLTDRELTQLSSAYEFLRRVEHILQMENGVQTHTVPNDGERRSLLAGRIRFAGGGDLDRGLQTHTANVSRIFSRVLPKDDAPVEPRRGEDHDHDADTTVATGIGTRPGSGAVELLRKVSPHFASIAEGQGEELLLDHSADREPDYAKLLNAAVMDVSSKALFRERLRSLRKKWLSELLSIVVADAAGYIDLVTVKRRQTRLAEAALDAGLTIVREELEEKYSCPIPQLQMSVLALGKLGGGAIDYDSDLDLIFVYDEGAPIPDGTSHAEFFGRAAELLVTTLSSMTREGSLYRVDLRLRPYGSKGLSCIGGSVFLDYIRDKAAVWEMLAFVKLRVVGGDIDNGRIVEARARYLIHERSKAIDPFLLRSETITIRDALEQQRTRGRRSADVDIKYGEGGMLDVYFAMRYLQLRWDVRDDGDDRSTLTMLARLATMANAGVDERSALSQLSAGYSFLSQLDHSLRLAVGRTTRIPSGNETAMKTIADRTDLTSPADLIEELTSHRIAIRSAYETILGVRHESA